MMDITKSTNPAEQLETYAKAKGVPLTVACEKAGVEFSTVARWRKKKPRTIEIIEQVLKAIDDVAESRGHA
jgi:hypothetical protein